MKEIQLTQGKVAIVDDEDFEWLNQWKWCVNGDGYAHRHAQMVNGKQTKVKMHREILGLIKGDSKDCDHINGNRIDNRRENLMVCKRSENSHNQKISIDNTSGFKGVYWDKPYKKWRARILINNKRKHLGYFTTPEEAHSACCEAAIKYYGEFANFGHGCVTLEDNNVSR